MGDNEEEDDISEKRVPKAAETPLDEPSVASEAEMVRETGEVL